MHKHAGEQNAASAAALLGGNVDPCFINPLLGACRGHILTYGNIGIRRGKWKRKWKLLFRV